MVRIVAHKTPSASALLNPKLIPFCACLLIASRFAGP